MKHIWKTCTNTENCVLLCIQFICPRRLLYLVCFAGVQWRSSFVFLSQFLIEEPSSNEFFQSSEPTWKSFLSLARTRCFISVPPVPKIIYKKINNSYNGISCSWTSCNGIQHFLKCSICFCPHTRFGGDVGCIVSLCRVISIPGLLTRLY